MAKWIRNVSLFASAAALCVLADLAVAAPTRIRGTITAFNGNVLTIKSRDGQTVKLTLNPKYAVIAADKASLSDIKTNAFVGATTVQRKGEDVALEVHIFPVSAQSRTAASFPDNAVPNGTMTNAPVTGDVSTADGHKLTLTYKGGQKTILVTSHTSILAESVGAPADVKVGEAIVVSAADKQPDGSFTAARITVGRNGANPP